jgi:putative addiction module killer protein
MQIERGVRFARWFKKLDIYIQVRILYEVNKLSSDNFSNCKTIGEGIHELKINYQKGYRIYFTNINDKIILLLCGGDKSSQEKDIKKAKELKKELVYEKK